MTLEELERIGEALYGPRWHTEMRTVLGISHRGFANYLEGKRTLPEGLEEKLAPVVADRLATLSEIRRTLKRRTGARK